MSAPEKKIRQPKKWEDLMEWLVVLLAVIFLNIPAQQYFFRIDLTEEKRYTISDAAETILTDLDDNIYVEVYLTGELNAQFKRLQKSVRETLEEFRTYGGDKVQYKFVNIKELGDEEKQKRFMQELSQKGLIPTTVVDEVQGSKVQTLIFPGALVSYGNREKAVQLLGSYNQRKISPEQQLNEAVENVEFELISAIQTLSIKQKPQIAFIEGHDETNPQGTFDIFNSLSEDYIIERVNLARKKHLDNYDAVIVSQPKRAFSEYDRYKLDQFVVKGGKALFFVDMVQMNIDSIAQEGTYAFGYELRLRDLLFSYGVRVNTDLMQDQNMGGILLNVGNFGDRPNLQPFRFPYYVIFNKFAGHPITKSMDAVYGRFVSTIDTVKATGIRKTPLIFSSEYSRIKNCPTMIELDDVKREIEPELYNRKHLPAAYLLEGKFKSAYSGRFPPEGVDRSTFSEQGEKPGKVLVVSDGDFIRNDVDPRNGSPLPLGLDRLTGNYYMNLTFLKNSLSYMLREDGVIASRKKEIKMRPLDRFRVQEERTSLQIMNVVIPALIVILLGVLRFYLRKRHYEKQK